jgi:hypothetical protein
LLCCVCVCAYVRALPLCVPCRCACLACVCVYVFMCGCSRSARSYPPPPPAPPSASLPRYDLLHGMDAALVVKTIGGSSLLYISFAASTFESEETTREGNTSHFMLICSSIHLFILLCLLVSYRLHCIVSGSIDARVCHKTIQQVSPRSPTAPHSSRRPSIRPLPIQPFAPRKKKCRPTTVSCLHGLRCLHCLPLYNPAPDGFTN